MWNSTKCTSTCTRAVTKYNKNTSIINHTYFACQIKQWILPHWCDKHKIRELCFVTDLCIRRMFHICIDERKKILKKAVRCNIDYQPSAGSRRLTNNYITHENAETNHMSCHCQQNYNSPFKNKF